MFELETDIATLDELLDSIEVLTSNVRLNFQPEGVSIPVGDKANVGKADIWMDSTAFNIYEAGRITVGISVEKLRTIVDLSNADETLFIEVFPHQQKLDINVDSQEFKIGLFDPESINEVPDTPDMSRPVSFTLPQEEFQRAMFSADAFVDHIKFVSDEDEQKFKMEAKGDTDEYRSEWKIGENQHSATGRGKYSLDYLTELADAIPSNSEVEIEFGIDVPALFHYNIADEEGTVEFSLAPRLENN